MANSVALTTSQRALLIGLAIDNFGSGLFLPLTLVYLTRESGLSLGTAGAVLAAATVLSLFAPALVMRLIGTMGARQVVIAAQVIQACGLTIYLVSTGVAGAVLAAFLLATGIQTFYSALLGLIAETAPEGPKDSAYAVVAMVRAGAFGMGTVTAGSALALIAVVDLRVIAVADVATFLIAAGILAKFVHPDHSTEPRGHRGSSFASSSREFLAVLLLCALAALPIDFLLVGFPVFATDVLRTSPIVVGATLAVSAVTSSVGGSLVIRLTDAWSRTRSIAVGIGGAMIWCASLLTAQWLPAALLPVWIPVSTAALSLGSMLCTARISAMAEAAVPVEQRARQLALLQYSFTAAQITAPLLAGQFEPIAAVPWLILLFTSVTALALARWLGRRLGVAVTRPTAPQAD
ncbi:MFS transporter [Nocardia africana]|uniref:MFS transporter n=1 Tax=Nocardia africana TaxID=134964 RepID=A0ABW6NCP1_9NOCA